QVLDPARFKPVITSHHAVLLKTMALEGRGLAWLPQSLVRTELAEGRLVMAVAAAEAAGWQVPVEIRLFRAAASQTPMTEALWGQVISG
ncbi:MAG: LysR family transcriptional regulator, partial [Rhodoferax sp.]|nr:LysR family transcriptional regulator [Rhodoferax sp.]